MPRVVRGMGGSDRHRRRLARQDERGDREPEVFDRYLLNA
jgi:hypothetical protein